MLLFLFLTSLFLYYPHLAFAYEDPRATLCGADTSTYAANSTFSANLAVALTTLQNTTAATGFNDTTAGNLTGDSVTALALCRANYNSSGCQTCVDAAALGIRQACPNQTVAQVWYTYCMVRYSNLNFLGKADLSDGFMLYDTRVAPDQDVYYPKVKILLQNLSYTAGVSDIRAAVGRTSFVDNLTIYGYVDCTRDVDGPDCTSCLVYAIGQIVDCCSGQWAGWIATPTCNIQFDMDPVHYDWLDNPPEINTDLSPPPASAIGPAADEHPLYGGFGSGSGSGSSGKKTRAVIAAVVAFILVVGVVVVRWRVKREKGKREETNEHVTVSEYTIGIGSFVYDLDVLVTATDNFSPANRIGGGGFGSVYRGKLPSGEEIAVKRLRDGSKQGLEEFLNEVNVLVKMQHRNLVRLLGCFIQVEEMMLVYEYLPNKSLDYFLFDRSKRALLDWTKRFNIIIGVARGLLYLHEESRLKIIHRDIKASNILLDEQMNPKISDFGLARLLTDEQTRVRTRRIVGTFGYMSPEYAVRGVVSTKSDVFSFGVLILEIIAGRRNFDSQLDEESRELLKFARELKQEGREMELVDVTVGSFPREDVLRCIRIGLLCCQECVEDRPTMDSVLVMLTNNSVTFAPVGRLGYQGSSDHIMTQNPAVNPPSFSHNSSTISTLTGR